MDQANLKQKMQEIKSKRGFLVSLLDKPDLGTLRIDVNQALEELDELIEDFDLTFPEDS
jgi:hypothetical protein